MITALHELTIAQMDASIARLKAIQRNAMWNIIIGSGLLLLIAGIFIIGNK